MNFNKLQQAAFCVLCETTYYKIYAIWANLHIIATGAAQPWKPMPLSSRYTVFVLMLTLEELWSSAIIESAECFLLLCKVRVHIQQLRCLTLCGWVTVVLWKTNKQTVSSWTVEEARNFTNWLLQWWHPITVIHLNSLSFTEMTHSFTNAFKGRLNN